VGDVALPAIANLVGVGRLVGVAAAGNPDVDVRAGSSAAGKTSSPESTFAASRRAALATAGFSGASGRRAASQML
jgi:hypothetical protein